MNKDEFAEKIMQMEDSLYAVARAHFTSPHDCADAVQETVLKAWKNRHTLKNTAFFKTWVTRIAINQCKTMLGQHARIVVLEKVPEPPRDATDPLLYEGVMGLDLKYRLPFVLHHVEGYTAEEIAQMMRIPRGTVLSRLQRARGKLKTIYSVEEVCSHVR